MAKKLRVGVLFGGRSGEHEVSLLSAASILKAIDRTKFNVVPIGITKDGHWLAAGDATHLLEGDSSAVARRLRAGDPEATPGAKLLHQGIPTLFAPEPCDTAALATSATNKGIDVVFPVLHGTFGEDGTIQGLFELAGIAYVGSGVLGSSAGMDKDVMKRLFAQAGLPIVKHVTILRSDWETSPRKAVSQVEKALKYPVFVKPANLGSSVGISKAHDRKELGPALDIAAKYDRKLIVEQGVGGKQSRAGERRSQGQRGGRDYSRQGILRLRGEIFVGGLGTGDPRQADQGGDEKDSRDGGCRVSCLRSGRAGAGRLPDGTGWQAAHLHQRSEHAAGIHADQHVSKVVGGHWHFVPRPDYQVDRTGSRAPAGKEPEQLQPAGRVTAGIRKQGLGTRIRD